jgi:hypothetical protein
MNYWRETHLPDLVLRPSLLFSSLLFSSSTPTHSFSWFYGIYYYKKDVFLKAKTEYSRPSDTSLQPQENSKLARN